MRHSFRLLLWFIVPSALVAYAGCGDDTNDGALSPDGGNDAAASLPDATTDSMTVVDAAQDDAADAGQDAACTPGTVDCACRPSNSCDVGLACKNGTCRAGCCSGYEADAGACTWGGGIENPDFATADAWTASKGVTLTPGKATFATNTVCGSASLGQTFVAPETTCAEPLALTLKSTNTFTSYPIFLGVSVNSGWNVLTLPAGVATTSTFCLGGHAFGGNAKLAISPLGTPATCPASGAETLTHVGIDVAAPGTCPPYATVPNGDFEGTSAWTLTPGGATAEIKNGVGDGATRGLHLATATFCTSPRVTGTLSVPLSEDLPNPALQVWSTGTAGAEVSVNIGSVTKGPVLRGTGAPQKRNICLPRWALGTVQNIQLAFVDRAKTQDCSLNNGRDFVIDDLAFVSDASCAGRANAFDPGFENASNADVVDAWRVDVFANTGATVTIKADAAAAHSGNNYAQLRVTQPCPDAALTQSIAIPSPTSGAGPALKFWYQRSTGSHSSASLKIGGGTAPALPAVAAWTPITVCLDPSMATRPSNMTFTLSGGAGACANTYAAETMLLDDVELTTDAACPAN